MAIETTGRGLDWLQRGQALWTALVALKLWVVPVVTGFLGAYLGTLENVRLTQVYLFALYGAAGGILLLVGATHLAGLFRSGGQEVLTIHSARYGVGDGSYKDVTTILQGFIIGNRVDVPVNNDTLRGDPYPQQHKHLCVLYSIGNGPKRSVVRHEHASLVLPGPHGRALPTEPDVGGTATHRQWEQDALNELQEDARKNRSIVAERDALRKALEETQQDRERIRGLLGEAEQSIRNSKRDSAILRIEWFAERARMKVGKRRLDGGIVPDIKVTVRYAVYADYDLANQIKAILAAHTQWLVIDDFGSNPVIAPMKEHKVIFESGISREFDEIASAFAAGELITGPIGRRAAARPTDNHLVIEIAPVRP